MMAEIRLDKLDLSSSTKQKADGPNYFGYYKQLILDQISQNGDCFGGETGENFASGKGVKFSDLCVSTPIFTEAIGKGLADFKKEGLLEILNGSVVRLDQEINEMVDLVLSTLQFELSQKQASNAVEEDEDLMTPNLRKRISQSFNMKQINSNLPSIRQVCNSIQARNGTDEVSSNGYEMHKHHLLAKLDSMSVNLEEYLDTIVSMCRPMTIMEKHHLGKRILKLPEVAVDRVVDILQPNKIPADYFESIPVNLEDLDDVKLWRLYCYVELVQKMNKR